MSNHKDDLARPGSGSNMRVVAPVTGRDQRETDVSAMTKSPTGYPVQSPHVAIANRPGEIMMRVACEFGFTPASRGPPRCRCRR
jgi:hypothetical protein